MREPPIIAGLAVNIFVPLLGIAAYLLLCRRMLRSGVELAAVLSYFILFAIYGGWLVVFLTAFFWEWSGMASLGVFFLLFFAPFISLAASIVLWRQRPSSIFHRVGFVLSAFYAGFVPLVVIGWWTLWYFGPSSSSR